MPKFSGFGSCPARPARAPGGRPDAEPGRGRVSRDHPGGAPSSSPGSEAAAQPDIPGPMGPSPPLAFPRLPRGVRGQDISAGDTAVGGDGLMAGARPGGVPTRRG